MAWNVQHVALPAYDLSVSIAYFERVFGMRNSEPRFIDNHIHRRQVGWFEPGDGTTLVHLSPPSANFGINHGVHLNPSLRGHLAIEVEDAGTVKARLDALDVYATEPKIIAYEGFLQMYTYDPSANCIEIIQAI